MVHAVNIPDKKKDKSKNHENGRLYIFGPSDVKKKGENVL